MSKSAGNASGAEKRGRFEVWPEQTISHADWLALPKAQVGYLDQVKLATGLEATRPVLRQGQRASDTIVLPLGSVAPGSPAATISLTAFSAPDGAQTMLRQYTTAMSALTSLRGSLIGMGKQLGVSPTGDGTSHWPPLVQGSGGSASTTLAVDAHVAGASTASGRAGDRDTMRDSAHEQHGSSGMISVVSTSRGLAPSRGADEKEDSAAHPQGLAGHPREARDSSASSFNPPTLARTMSTMSAMTSSSATDAVEASSTVRGGGGTEVERVRADLDTLRAAKTKLVQDNKALQEKLLTTQNELTVAAQKLKRHGLN